MEELQSQASNREKRSSAIVMISVGNRPWADRCAATFEFYSQQYGITMRIEREYPPESEFPFPKLPDKPGRKNKLAYACKAYFAWKYLEEYGFDRVAVVDDTCCVRAGTPNFFDLVPYGMCGYTRTAGSHAQESFEVIQAFIRERNEVVIAYDPTLYMNSGLMLYDRTMRDALHKLRICQSSELLFARFPNQTLTYYLLRRGDIPQFELPKSFNTMPALSLPDQARRNLADAVPHIKDGVWIYHLSALYRNRESLLRQIAKLFLEEWKLANSTLRDTRK